jgi:hypothetical protein
MVASSARSASPTDCGVVGPPTLERQGVPPLSAVYCRSLNSEGSASAAGARPGFQSRGYDAVSPISHKKLRNQASALTAQGQRADSNDPIKVAIDAVWGLLTADTKAQLLAIVEEALKRGDGE